MASSREPVARRAAVAGGAATLAAAGYAAVWILGRAAGSTAAERRSTLPGDSIVPTPDMGTDHGRTIRAPAERIWPWLTQMGWHRGGYYTPHWVDRLLFPDNWPSLDRLDPDLVRDLAVGDTFPDGPPGTAQYVVVDVDAPHLLVLHSTTHVPPGWQEKYGARISWTWVFRLTEHSPGVTRVHVRVRGHMEPRWFRAFYQATVVPADFIMATGMLRGLKRRAEADNPPVTNVGRARGRPPCRHRSRHPLSGDDGFRPCGECYAARSHSRSCGRSWRRRTAAVAMTTIGSQ